MLGKRPVQLRRAQPKLAREREKEIIGVGQMRGAAVRCRAGRRRPRRLDPSTRDLAPPPTADRRSGPSLNTGSTLEAPAAPEAPVAPEAPQPGRAKQTA